MADNKTFPLRTDNVTTDNSAPGQLVIRKSFEFGVLTYMSGKLTFTNYTTNEPPQEHACEWMTPSDDIERFIGRLSAQGWQIVPLKRSGDDIWFQRESTPVVLP